MKLFLPSLAFSCDIVCSTIDKYLARDFNLTILHTNDIHSHFLQSDKRGGNCTEEKAKKKQCYGGVSRIITKVREIKKQKTNTLFFNAGDFYQGTVWYTVLKYNIVALAIGKHDVRRCVLWATTSSTIGPEGLYPFLVRNEKR
uniref:5'-nucleotidase n=1 Tax=Ixodes ricinus TaxID=34613 RepID=V5ICS2_IXORI